MANVLQCLFYFLPRTGKRWKDSIISFLSFSSPAFSNSILLIIFYAPLYACWIFGWNWCVLTAFLLSSRPYSSSFTERWFVWSRLRTQERSLWLRKVKKRYRGWLLFSQDFFSYIQQPTFLRPSVPEDHMNSYRNSVSSHRHICATRKGINHLFLCCDVNPEEGSQKGQQLLHQMSTPTPVKPLTSVQGWTQSQLLALHNHITNTYSNVGAFYHVSQSSSARGAQMTSGLCWLFGFFWWDLFIFSVLFLEIWNIWR